jgi:hypothetical protein
MKSRQFSLRRMMVLVAACGLGLAAFHQGTRLWAAVARTETVILVLGAAIGAFARTGRTRYAWAGFAVFGVVALGPQTLLNPSDLVVSYSLSFLVDPMTGTTALPAPADVVRYQCQHRIGADFGAILFGMIGAIVGSAVYRERDQGRDGPTDQVHLPPDLSS